MPNDIEYVETKAKPFFRQLTFAPAMLTIVVRALEKERRWLVGGSDLKLHKVGVCI